ncbi:choice-of-anchor P family protein [Haloechinothrix halophila]|uniref:choice-of-anchor P family protein n=1 Tax=Haloechinothrix halophila TaxID=1069073 RepID=UPI00042A0712|nr:choice-of-anchor P family protein [Haloechinothrix halophila]
MRKKRYAALAFLSAFALAVSGAIAFADPPGSSSSNSEAVITGSFSDECRDFEADAEKPDGKPKDISYVELHYADGRVVKDEDVNSPHYEIDEGPGDEKTHVFVKSGTTTERFDCDGNGGGNGGDDPECSDGVDNDGDKKIDHPEDPGCDSPEDNDESDDPKQPECSDGVDNDGDKKTDFPDDPGCESSEDDSEAPNPECSDGVDNDGDKKVDEDDPECHTDGDATNPDSYDPRDDDESNGGTGDPECSDGVDNDGDKKIDFPDDPGCESSEDDSEAPNPECSDGVDNDGDNKVDADDPECHTDGDATNPDSYDPRDDDESNGGTGDGAFSCRASALRIDGSPLAPIIGDPFEPFVANADQDPCVTDDGSSPLQGGSEQDFGSGSVKAAYATTDDSEGADANAGVAHVLIEGDPGFVEATVLDAHASGRCEGGQPVLSGGSTVATLNLNGNPVALPPDNEHVEIPLGPLATLHLNWTETTQTEDGEVATFRALYLDAGELEPATGDVIIGEAIADYSGNPC